MELSLGPFLTCLTTSMILTVYFYYVLYRKKTFFAQGKRFVFIGIILILLRMAVPLNFPFTYTLRSEHILPTLIGFLYDTTPFHGWSILDILYRIVFIGAVIQLIRLLISKIRLNNYIKGFEVKDTAEYHHLYELASHYTTDNIRPHCRAAGYYFSGYYRTLHTNITITGYFFYRHRTGICFQTRTHAL